MLDLYVDFDGVILNTIDITYMKIEDAGISFNEAEKIEKFYEELDWVSLFDESRPIKDSLNNLKKLMDSELFNVSVLSHVNSDSEAKAKREYLAKNVPGLKVIPVKITTNKCDAVDCKNAILVDDYMGNLELWDRKGGVSVKFSDKGKKYKFITISDLDMLFDKYDEIRELIEIKDN